MPEAWSTLEVEAVVTDYFDMLAKELRGDSYNKAEHNRRLQRLLNGRPRGSIERKHQNISAVLIECGFPYIDGYKPLSNYQQLLRRIVELRLSNSAPLHETVSRIVDSNEPALPGIDNILSIQIEPPKNATEGGRVYERTESFVPAKTKNYLEQESRNRALGSAGELLILNFEYERLRRAGKRALAERIEHVSSTQGDHLGYDIQSFETDGRDRLIEVKTTRFGALTPFFASRNEVNVSENRNGEFHLYRLFKFTTQPRLFVLPGSLHRSCTLEPTNFAARLN